VPCLSLTACVPFHAVPRGEFEVVYDRYELKQLPSTGGGSVTVQSPAPGAHADVVLRNEPARTRVYVRRNELPRRRLPIVVAVGNVASFEATRDVSDVRLAGDAAQAWFTPGRELHLKGVHPGTSQLELRLSQKKRLVLPVEVR
jgi:hypothetical protein